MIITLFGDGGEGKGTIGPLLAKKLEYPFTSIGGMMRDRAKSLGLTLIELDRLMKTDKGVTDRWLDDQLKYIGAAKQNFVVDARLGWYFIPDSYRVKLFCRDNVRFARMASRDGVSFNVASEVAVERERVIRDRYFALYGIQNLGQDSDFSLVVNTSDLSPEDAASQIVTQIHLTFSPKTWC